MSFVVHIFNVNFEQKMLLLCKAVKLIQEVEQTQQPYQQNVNNENV